MQIVPLLLTQIDATGGLRPVSDAWVSTMADLSDADGAPMWAPIDVVAVGGDRYRIVDGRRRYAAAQRRELDTIEARIFTGDDAALRLHEIKANMLQSGVTALERAIYLATWKDLHEAVNGPAKRGRKAAAPPVPELAQNSAAIFAGLFSRVAAETLGISERSVQVAVQVARDIAEPLRLRLARHRIADTMSELLALAVEPAERQERIADLLLSDPPQAGTVSEAVAILDHLPAPREPAAWEKAYARVSRLPPREQDRLFDSLAASIERWQAGRVARKGARAA